MGPWLNWPHGLIGPWLSKGYHWGNCSQGLQPLCCLIKCSSLSATYKKHEDIKRRAYGQRIREVEHASFTPLVMSVTGGLAHEATIFYKHLASLLSTKWGDSYVIIAPDWLCCRLSFSLLRSVIFCLRSAWSSSGHYDRAPPPMDLVRVESYFMDQLIIGFIYLFVFNWYNHRWWQFFCCLVGIWLFDVKKSSRLSYNQSNRRSTVKPFEVGWRPKWFEGTKASIENYTYI